MPLTRLRLRNSKTRVFWRRTANIDRCNYLNNVLEQDHRAIKRRIRASQHFRSFWGAWRTIAGYEAIHMIRKGQACWSAMGPGPVCCTASFLLCLESLSDSFSYRTHLPFDFKVATLPHQAPDPRQSTFQVFLGRLAHNCRLRGDSYDPQRP